MSALLYRPAFFACRWLGCCFFSFRTPPTLKCATPAGGCGLFWAVGGCRWEVVLIRPPASPISPLISYRAAECSVNWVAPYDEWNLRWLLLLPAFCCCCFVAAYAFALALSGCHLSGAKVVENEPSTAAAPGLLFAWPKGKHSAQAEKLLTKEIVIWRFNKGF